MPMLRINSCTPNTPSYEESEEERLEREALREEKKLMTRKEKKAKDEWRTFRTSSTKAKKFDVPEKDKMTSRRRKSHKHSTTKTKHKRDTKSFYKFKSIFKEWLDNNIERFNYRPIATTDGEYIFEGIINNITFGISEYEAYLTYGYEGGTTYDKNETIFDIYYIAYIGDEKYHPQKGHYDGDRVDGIYTYFATREELYINEVFEYVISHCNEMFVPNNSLYLYDSCGSTGGTIETSDETDRKVKEDYTKELGEEEANKLLLEDKTYRTIKYDLFDSSKEPLIRYAKRL